MHPSCYFRTDNIEVMGPFRVTGPVLKFCAVECEIASAGHARLYEIETMFNLTMRGTRRGTRPTLKIRRMRLIHDIDSARRRAQRIAFTQARRDRFIGPLTIHQANGHPF